MCGRKAEALPGNPSQVPDCRRGVGPSAMGLLPMEEPDAAWEGWHCS